ncbi:hypothetical protein I3842_14G002000 [Carya illinoinensis]|uniref:Uncharacterized protein n=1 Tax=Carya illinoinensis TaxID=32201 RepID=A0A922AG13_CARIL|nr:hypothetical protein I3842_14G002000 [Carya illinoinensis]
MAIASIPSEYLLARARSRLSWNLVCLNRLHGFAHSCWCLEGGDSNWTLALPQRQNALIRVVTLRTVIIQ